MRCEKCVHCQWEHFECLRSALRVAACYGFFLAQDNPRVFCGEECVVELGQHPDGRSSTSFVVGFACQPCLRRRRQKNSPERMLHGANLGGVLAFDERYGSRLKLKPNGCVSSCSEWCRACLEPVVLTAYEEWSDVLASRRSSHLTEMG